MTREAAHHKVTTCRKNWSSKQLEKIEIVIDQIYDDFEEQLDMEKRKAYLDGSNDCFKSLKEAGKLK